MACLGLRDAATARLHLAEALDLARAQREEHDLIAALNAMAQLHRTQDEMQDAVRLYEEALDLARSTDDRESIALALLNLAMAIAGSDTARISPMLLEVLAIVDEIGSKPVLQSALEVSAGLAATLGDCARAAELFGAAEAHAQRTGLQRDWADELFLAPLIAAARRTLGDGPFAAAEAKGRALAGEDAKAQARAWLAAIVRP